jgi:type III pantothenate kinase
MNLLAIDIGNTTSMVGYFQDDVLAKHWSLSSSRARTPDEVYLLLEMLLQQVNNDLESIDKIIIASVVPALTDVYQHVADKYLKLQPLFVDENTNTGIVLKVDEPEALGADRIVNAASAYHQYGGPQIIVDLGTATTADIVSKDGAYIGGIIAPGMLTSAEHLFQRAAKLHKVSLKPPDSAIGRNTAQALRSGILFGTAGAIDRIVENIRKEMEVDVPVIATGGLSEMIAPLCNNVDKVDLLLTLRGLYIISNLQ